MLFVHRCAAHCDAGAKFYILVRLIDRRKKEAARFETELDLSDLALRKVWHKVCVVCWPVYAKQPKSS